MSESRAPQSEKTPFAPNSPYAVAKLYAFWITKLIETPMEFSLVMVFCLITSPLRGETFVTKKSHSL